MIYKFDNIEETVEPKDVDMSSFKVNDKLNSDIWNGDRMNQHIRRQLLSIARDFIKGLDEIDELDIDDVIVTGSLANYNWNEKYSDIDLHIVVNLDSISNNKTLTKGYFDAKRKAWNDRHEDISIYGYPVEIYVQDEREPHASSGIYSLLNDDWIKKPSRENMEVKDEAKVRKDVSYYMNKTEEIEKEFRSSASDKSVLQKVYDDCEALLDEIKSLRKEGFSEDESEMNPGNITFKSLRRNGTIETLMDIKTVSYDLLNSIN